jgi:hypothetical protein
MPIEASSFGGQAVDVGAADVLGTVAPQLRPQVVDTDQ